MIRLLITSLVAVLIAGFAGSVASAQGAASCTQFASQAEAQGAYAADPAGAAALDEDGDGVACDNVIYSNLATDFTPVSGAAAIGAAGITPAQEAAEGGIGASGVVPAAAPASETTAGGIGAPGITPAPGVGAAGTTGQQRDAVAGSMTGMPNTGTGEAAAGSLLVPAAFLLGALGAGWMAIQSRPIAGAVRSA